jgi:hypothetical protein
MKTARRRMAFSYLRDERLVSQSLSVPFSYALSPVAAMSGGSAAFWLLATFAVALEPEPQSPTTVKCRSAGSAGVRNVWKYTELDAARTVTPFVFSW